MERNGNGKGGEREAGEGKVEGRRKGEGKGREGDWRSGLRGGIDARSLYLQPSSIRILTASWIIFLNRLPTSTDLSKRSPVSPILHFVVLSCQHVLGLPLLRRTLDYCFLHAVSLFRIALDHNKKAFFSTNCSKKVLFQLSSVPNH